MIDTLQEIVSQRISQYQPSADFDDLVYVLAQDNVEDDFGNSFPDIECAIVYQYQEAKILVIHFESAIRNEVILDSFDRQKFFDRAENSSVLYVNDSHISRSEIASKLV